MLGAISFPFFFRGSWRNKSCFFCAVQIGWELYGCSLGSCGIGIKRAGQIG